MQDFDKLISSRTKSSNNSSSGAPAIVDKDLKYESWWRSLPFWFRIFFLLARIQPCGIRIRLWLPPERLPVYSMRPIQCLASSKILTPPPSPSPPPLGTVSRARLDFYDINGDLGRNKRPAWFCFNFFRCLWEFAVPLTYFSGSCWQGRHVWKSWL